MILSFFDLWATAHFLVFGPNSFCLCLLMGPINAVLAAHDRMVSPEVLEVILLPLLNRLD